MFSRCIENAFRNEQKNLLNRNIDFDVIQKSLHNNEVGKYSNILNLQLFHSHHETFSLWNSDDIEIDVLHL